MKLKKVAVLALAITISSCSLNPLVSYAGEAIPQEMVSTDSNVQNNEVLENGNEDAVTNDSNTSIDTSAGQENEVTEDNEKENNEKENDKKKNKKKKSSAKKAKKSSKKNSYTKADLRLMSSIIYCEAGIESYQGKLAVGIVIMNRIKSKSFPSTLKGVIYQKYQFSPVRNGSLKRSLAQYNAGRTKTKNWKECISAAKKTLKGQSTIKYKGKSKNMKGYYYFSAYLKNSRMRIGGHRFK